MVETLGGRGEEGEGEGGRKREERENESEESGRTRARRAGRGERAEGSVDRSRCYARGRVLDILMSGASNARREPRVASLALALSPAPDSSHASTQARALSLTHVQHVPNDAS